MRRRTLKRTGILISLLLVLGLVAYMLLLAVVPDRLILNAVSAELGLDVTAKSLTIGWTGHTRLRDVTVTLPVTDEEIFSASDIQVSHRAPLWLLIGGSANLTNVEIENPSLRVRQNANGQWNLQDAWLRVNAGRETANGTERATRLPKIDVRNASVLLTDANDVTETIGPVSFEGSPKDGAIWSFSLKANPDIIAEGQTAQGRDWSHRVDFSAEQITSLLTILTGSDLGAIEAAGQWDGRIVDGAVVGQLNLERLQIGKTQVQGTMNVNVGTDRVTLRPNPLHITEANLAADGIQITSGAVHLNGDGVQVEQTNLQAGGLSASVDGRWTGATGLGDATVSWMARQVEGDSEGHGTCQITCRWPRLGRKEVEIKLAGTAKTDLGHGNITAKILGTGQAWNNSDWVVTIPKLIWSHDDREFDIGEMEAGLALSASNLQLTSLHWRDAQELNAQARFDLGTGKWSAQVDGQGVHLAALTSQPVNLRFSGAGDSSKLSISELNVTQGQRTLAAEGELSLSDRTFRTLHIAAQWPAPARASAKTAPSVQPGHWHFETDITGRLDPIALDIQGALKGTNVPLGKRVIAEVNIPVQANLDPERVAITTEPFTLLDGQWRISGQHKWSNTLTQLSLVTDDLSLRSAASMAGSPVACQGRVKAQLQLAAPGAKLQGAVAVGSWSAEAIEIPPFKAETAKGKVQIANGLVRFDEIHLDHEKGQADGRLQFRLDRPQNLSLAFKMRDWPVLFEQRSLALYLDGTADTQLDVVAKTMQGRSRLSGDIVWKDKPFGRMTMANSVAGRTLAVQELRVETLGGVIKGQAELPLDKWAQGTGQLKWEGVEPNALEPWWPAAARLQGTLSGSLVAVQANEANRPPEPTRIEINTKMAEGRFGTGQIQGGQIIAFLGPRRLLINHADFDLFGGQAKGRASISPHAGKLYATVVADINDLDLDQLVHAVQAEAAKTPGRLAGSANLLLASDFSSLSGRANLDISQSDLTGNGIVNALYQTMRLNLGKTKLEGTGQVRMRLNGPRVIIPSFVYFNRGVEIRGVGQIDDIWQGRRSPVSGYAFGSTRILKGLSLPGVRELDRVVSSLQSNAASVKIAGRLDEPKIDVVPLPAVTGTLRRLLWAQLRGDTYEEPEAQSN